MRSRRPPLPALWLIRLLSCFALWPSAAAWACGPYAVGLYEYGALYYRDDAGHWTGLDKEVVEALARRSGCKLVLRTESRVRIWAQIAAGQLDITTSAQPTPERERLVDFAPYLDSHQYVVVRAALAATTRTPEAFLADRSLRVLTVRGYAFTPTLQRWVDQLRAQGQLMETSDQPAAIRAFKAGRGAAVILGESSLASARQHEAFPAHEALSFTPEEHNVGALAMSRKTVSAADRALLRQTLQDMQRDGSLAALKKRFLGDLPP